MYKILNKDRRCWLCESNVYPLDTWITARQFGFWRGFQVYETYAEALDKLRLYDDPENLVIFEVAYRNNSGQSHTWGITYQYVKEICILNQIT